MNLRGARLYKKILAPLFFSTVLFFFSPLAHSSFDPQECKSELLLSYSNLGIDIPAPEVFSENSSLTGMRFEIMEGQPTLILASYPNKKMSLQSLCRNPQETGLEVVFVHESFHYLMHHSFTNYTQWLLLRTSETEDDPHQALIEGFAIAGEVYYSEQISRQRLPESSRHELMKHHLERRKLLQEKSVADVDSLSKQKAFSVLWYAKFMKDGLSWIKQKDYCSTAEDCYLKLKEERNPAPLP